MGKAHRDWCEGFSVQSKLIKETWLLLFGFHSPAIWIFIGFSAKMVEQMLCAYAIYKIQGLVASESISIYICITSHPGGNLSAELAHAYKLAMGFYCQVHSMKHTELNKRVWSACEGCTTMQD